MIKNHKYVVLLVATLAVFGFFNTAQAATVEELQTLINQLLAQIAQLQAQIAAMQGGQTTWCHSFNYNLRIGDRNDDIVALRTILAKEIVGSQILINSQDFDEEAASAVVAFQEKYRSEILSPYGLRYGTGYVGVSTRTKLNSLYGCNQACIQVITPAKNPTTNECKNFPTPCEVPAGWIKVSSCTDDIKPSITVLSPNGGEKFEFGKTYKITWSQYGLSNYVRIAIMRNGQLVDQLGAGGVVNNGSYLWTIANPNIVGDGYKVKIYCIDAPSIFDESNGSFSIISPNTPSVTVLSPNGGEVWKVGNTYEIKWKATGLDKVHVLLWSGKISGTYKIDAIASNLIASSGSYFWTVPSSTTVKSLQDSPYLYDYPYHKIEVVDARYGYDSPIPVKYSDESDNDFKIISATPSKSLSLTYPKGGEKLIVGQTYNITWQSTGVNNVMIELDDPVKPQGWHLVYSVPASAGSYSWTVPDLPVGSTYKMTIWDTSNTSVISESPSYFSIVGATTLDDIQYQIASISSMIPGLLEQIRMLAQ